MPYVTHTEKSAAVELIRILHGDIQVLFDLTFKHSKPVSEANIRAASTILRRWLVDGDAKLLNEQLFEPVKFPALDTSTIAEHIGKTGNIEFFLTAGVMVNGQPIQGIFHSTHNSATAELTSHLPMKFSSIGLKQFVNQRRIYYCGRWFTTGEIIRYVANKLGGNHYDTDRRDFYGLLDKVSTFMRYGGPTNIDSGSELYLILEPNSNEIIDGVHLEVIAAASSFIQMTIGDSPLIDLTSITRRRFSRVKLSRSMRSFQLIDNVAGKIESE